MKFQTQGTLGFNNATTALVNSSPTYQVVRSGPVPLQSIFNKQLMYVRVYNIIGGFSITLLDEGTEGVGIQQQILLINTGHGIASISVDSGATIAGETVYRLLPGRQVNVYWNGTSFIEQDC